MAIDQGTATIAVTTSERTWRVNIETALGADPVVTVWRENVKKLADGSILAKEQAAIVTRSLSEVATQSITVPGTSISLTMAQVAALIAAAADAWREADLAAPAAPAAPAP